MDVYKPKQLGRKDDQGKTRYELLDPRFAKGVADVLTDGAKKYEDNNWMKVEPFEDRYYAAAMRHFQDYRMGKKIDPESGKQALFHVACCVNFLLWKDNYGEEVE